MIEEQIEEVGFDVFEDPRNIKIKMGEYEELIDLYNSYPVLVPERGDIVNAIYCGESESAYLFNLEGLKDYIRVDNRPNESKYLKNLEEGDSIDVLITSIDGKDYFVTGSVCGLYESIAHESIKSLDDDAPIIAHIKSSNPAGYEVDLYQESVVLPGFMPNTLAGINKLHDPDSIVGQTFEVMVESYSDTEGTYIVSRKRYLQSLIPDEVSKLEYNKIYTGHVTGTMPFGVFVEFNGCLTGMVHKANLDEEFRDMIDQIKPGYGIEFFVKEIIKEKGKSYKIILTQILRETLWDNIKNGNVITGTVKDNKKFGVLVNLDEETVGLIHTSELEKKSNRKYTIGDSIEVKVLSVDRLNRKIFLTNNF